MEDIDLGGSKIIKLTNEKDADALLKEEGPLMIIYYMKTCGHCKDSYQAWKDLSNQVNEKIYMIESSNYPKITSFPTIKIVKGGNAIPYEQERTVALMKEALLKKGGRRRSSKLVHRTRKSKRTLRRNVTFTMNLRIPRRKRR